MLNIKNLFIILFILYFFSCSDNGNSGVNSSDAEIQPYYGTYLLQDVDCSGSDIQYLTIDIDGVSIFDFLGDSCDDTVSCYSIKVFDISESSIDTILNMSNEDSDISNGVVQIISDSLIVVSYDHSNEHLEFTCGKITDDISSFTPLCDQEYENTKDIADMMVYAVSDNGDLLWKNYIDGGIWDLGTSVTQLSDGGYMVFGVFDAISYSGCCYTQNGHVRDIIKLNSLGQELWRKKIDIHDIGAEATGLRRPIGKSLIETSRQDLVFIAFGLNSGMNVVMMDTTGNPIWNQNYPNFYFHNDNAELLETEYGDLAIIGGNNLTFRLLDYSSGTIIEEKLYDELGYSRAIVNVDDDFAILGNAKFDESGQYDPIFLLKVNSEGDEIWRKIWSGDIARPRTALDLIFTSDYGYLLFCYSDPAPYATLIKTDSEGNEEWRKQYNDYVGGSQGWIHQTEDGGYFMASGYAVTKLDANGEVEWNAAGPSSFTKFFNNGMVSGINHDMKKISNGAVMTGYGSADWE